MIAAGLLALSLLQLAVGRPNPSSQNFKLVRRGQDSLPVGFTKGGKSNHFPFMTTMVIALPQNNVTGLHAALEDVSNPSSENYGKHLSKAEVEQFVAPSDESVNAVTGWLNKNGIAYSTASPSGDMLNINVTIAQANALLNANFSTYTHAASNTTVVRTLSYSLPSDLDNHVEFIYPTTQFIPPTSSKLNSKIVGSQALYTGTKVSKRTDVPSQCNENINPSCLQAIYNIPTTPATAQGNLLGVSGFLQEVANKDDLQSFMSQARPDAPDGTFNVQSVDGGTDNGNGTLEASLDIQYTVGLATNVPTTFITVGEQNQDGDLGGFLDIINALLAQDAPPLVLSTSYGFDEPFLAAQAPEMAITLCNAYAQLGARGTSVIFSSGDGGVSGSQSDASCDGEAFIPTFPSGCPYVTSVGSTQNVGPETAAAFSAGGFSNIFPQPSYQASAVSGYLTTLGQTNAGLFNATGRAYPDVSTQGVNFAIIASGVVQAVDGTSASAPTFASVISLLNDQRLNAGSPPLGFLNYLLYSNVANAGALNDVTSGSNPGCGTQGFPAVAGWDPVTGLGTPDFNKLLAVL